MTRSVTFYTTLVVAFIFSLKIAAQNPMKFETIEEYEASQLMEGNVSTLDGYVPKMSVTKDGRIAYFSKASYQKPLYGMFSKKELIHEIYRAENVNGEWKNITKLEVCPKFASAKHPTVSEDGERLFFASNMKGSYGKYDIYVADIKNDGSLGVSKNLGPKVNTKEDELYPSIYNGTLLFFASEGRDGYGGLDLYATQVVHNSLKPSVNLGSHINSSRDDYAIQLTPEKGLGLVISNRGQNHTIAQYTVAYGSYKEEGDMVADNSDNFQSVINEASTHEFASTSFEDK
ncbi:MULTISPECIES: PD40 domain-containing protein [Flavobacteriaceae]|uniref:PD40 domain-containing protein n=1 Tax=Flavobacteriaceae TaxID=49546 RepID=UPI0014927D8E|nr:MULTISPECIES: PD40 domain-containing protein [Allomuricauda]MDC6364902.1 PD40 domain-containing protein [Muricauda sp. AC10]